MAHHQIRTEKECLNCGAHVEDRFCPHCGQENKVNRPKFHYLFTHFFEDVTHYDGKFWTTLKNLFLHPGIVVNDYLAGRRKKYVDPIRLYVFVSFITFFVPFILPHFNNDENEKTQTAKAKSENGFEGIEYAGHKNIKTTKQLDSIFNTLPVSEQDSLEYKIERMAIATAIDKKSDSSSDNNFHINFSKLKNINTVEQLDSAYKNKKLDLNWLTYKFVRKEYC